ncbi:MAG: hypothetical protein ACRDRO_27795 [Pseudonocardiaceae bacterium]
MIGDVPTADDKPADDTPPPPELGDAGKRALDAMKAKWKAERDRAKALETERDQLRQSTITDEAARKAEADRQAAVAEADKRANLRIVRSEVRAAATGKLADPKDALVFLNLDQFEVSEDGEIDSAEVAQAIDDLVKARPYLAAATAKRFQGTGDNGAVGKGNANKQVTETELKTMTPEQIVAAREKGQLKDLLGGK